MTKNKKTTKMTKNSQKMTKNQKKITKNKENGKNFGKSKK